jgi:hypothetical protein
VVRRVLLVGLVLVAGACSGVPDPIPPTTAPTAASPSSTTTSGPDQAATTAVLPSTGVAATDASPTVVASTGQAPADTIAEPISTAVATTLAPLERLRYVEVATVGYPIHAEPYPGSDRMAIASKEGTVWLWDEDGVDPVPLLDITDRVRDRGEQGLLGLAFAPDYPESGRIFAHYTALDGDTVLAEFLEDGGQVDPVGTVLWRTPQPAANHNGGMILFGSDGYLYMGLGDGGGAGDRYGHGQNDRSPLGALLRFDVSEPGLAIPAAGNPFPASEVWAIGLRNPWRFTIDEPSGTVIIADVGQNLFEEVSVAPVNAAGLNYGWPITEGLHCFDPPSGCDASGITPPVLEIPHTDSGTCSITGGVVYRGSAIPELAGHYLFSDYCGGYLRSFPVEGPFDDPTDWTDQVGNAGQVVAFGTDHAGEVYLLTASGSVLRLVAERG